VRHFSKLSRVVALAALMLGVGSVPSQASSFTFDSDELTHTYLFDQGDYILQFKVSFEEIFGSFDLAFEDEFVAAGTTVFDIDDGAGSEWNGFKCVGMAAEGGCLKFETSGPSGTGYFTGLATIAIRYFVTGWPLEGDPIDIGRTDDFSSFMIFSNGFRDGGDGPVLKPDYRMVRFHDGEASNITVGNHCEGANGASFEACETFNHAALVPEPGTTFTTLLMGVLGLTAFGRQLKQRGA
jgi:hypothetical protein